MARPLKTGLDYFPMDTYFDDEFRALEELHGNDGFTWMIKFWQSAYKTDDGIVDLSGIYRVLAAKTSRISTEKQEKIISDALELDLIIHLGDEKYTSTGIQKRMSKVVQERENDRNYHKNELSERKPSENPPKKGESKVKEIKENEIKEKKTTDLVFPENLNTPEFKEAWSEWCLHRIQKRNKLTDEAIKRQLNKLSAMGVTRAIAAIDHSITNSYTGIYEPGGNSGVNRPDNAGKSSTKYADAGFR